MLFIVRSVREDGRGRTRDPLVIILKTRPETAEEILEEGDRIAAECGKALTGLLLTKGPPDAAE